MNKENITMNLAMNLAKIDENDIIIFDVLALNNNDVWADGLLVFYEVFKFLEENVPETILPR